jgi:precorrin-6B methylase 2
MSKTQISREQLAQKVLAAVRQQPGCDDVREVAVTAVEVLNQASSWHVAVIDGGHAQRDTVYHAAKRVEDQLLTRFELAN